GTGPTPANPRDVAPPEIWVMGTKRTSMELAARLGTSFCLSRFLTPNEDPGAVIAEYRKRFLPSPELPWPRWSVAVAGVCAETEARARELMQAYGPEPLPITPTLVGSKEQCRAALESLRERTGTEELVFLDMCQTLEDRVRSCRLLAEAAGVSA